MSVSPAADEHSLKVSSGYAASAHILFRCILNIYRFVLAVIPSRKRITENISVRFARRPFRNNICGPL